jgi:CelD/BcsL family acetyltransferase involved in cellulose biosynthesis
MGWTAKGVYHSFKVGYDQSYRRVGPGHLLRKHLIETLFDDPQTRLIDFQGPVTQALASWSTRSYAIGRVVVAPRRLPSRVLLTGYRTLATAVRRFRRPSTRC